MFSVAFLARKLSQNVHCAAVGIHPPIPSGGSSLGFAAGGVRPQIVSLRRSGGHRRRPTTLRAQGAPGPGAPAADVIVVGAGLAGLSAALALCNAGKSVLVLEASDGVGGRVRSDVHPDGYILDRGFQIFLSGYPEAQRVLDYEALDLRQFYPGALVRHAGAFHRVADPFRRPVDGLLTLLPTHPIGDMWDKIRVGLLRLNTLLTPLDDLLRREEVSTEQRLKEFGFSDTMIDRFFRPFLGGIFFDTKLRVSSRLMEFVIRVLAMGDNCLPARGIGQIPKQLASKLPDGAVRLRSEVREVQSKKVHVLMEDGAEVVLYAAEAVIVATEGPNAARLLGPEAYAAADAATPDDRPARMSLTTASPNGTVCLYFAVDALPAGYEEPVLYLDGEGQRLVNNMCFPSAVAPTYAPPGKHLLSVSLIGTFADTADDELVSRVRDDIAAWFGAEYARSLQFLQIYRIPFAQPNQEVPTDATRSVRLGPKGATLYVCGDHRDTATFHGAMVSGRRAAEAVLEDIGGFS